MENSTEMNVNDVNEVVESGEQNGVVDHTSHNSDFDMVEAKESDLNRHAEEKADDGQGDAVDTHKQNREDNHFAKQARLKAEREAKANAERMANEKLAKILKESDFFC